MSRPMRTGNWQAWRALAAAIGCAAMLAGCAHTVTIVSEPPGAEIFVNGEAVGRAPVEYQEQSDARTREVVIVARLNGHETTELLVPRSQFNPWSLLAATPLCGLVGWAGALAALVGGTALAVPTCGLSFLAGVPGAIVLAASGCAWMTLSSPTLLMLAFSRQLPDELYVELPATGALQQTLEPQPVWQLPEAWPPEEDDYWQNPKPSGEPPSSQQPLAPPPTNGAMPY